MQVYLNSARYMTRSQMQIMMMHQKFAPLTVKKWNDVLLQISLKNARPGVTTVFFYNNTTAPP